MVVDDDSAIVEMMTRMLQMSGYEVEGYTDPEKALSSLRTSRPDLMISDYHMPKLNGRQLAERALRMVPHFPVIIATADPDRADVDGLKIRALLRKPMRFDDLVQSIERAISASRTSARLKAQTDPGEVRLVDIPDMDTDDGAESGVRDEEDPDDLHSMN